MSVRLVKLYSCYDLMELYLSMAFVLTIVLLSWQQKDRNGHSNALVAELVWSPQLPKI